MTSVDVDLLRLTADIVFCVEIFSWPCFTSTKQLKASQEKQIYYNS